MTTKARRNTSQKKSRVKKTRRNNNGTKSKPKPQPKSKARALTIDQTDLSENQQRTERSRKRNTRQHKSMKRNASPHTRHMGQQSSEIESLSWKRPGESEVDVLPALSDFQQRMLDQFGGEVMPDDDKPDMHKKVSVTLSLDIPVMEREDSTGSILSTPKRVENQDKLAERWKKKEKREKKIEAKRLTRGEIINIEQGFKRGMLCVIQHCSRPEYNSRFCRLRRWNQEKGRWVVSINNIEGRKSIDPINIVPANRSSASIRMHKRSIKRLYEDSLD